MRRYAIGAGTGTRHAARDMRGSSGAMRRSHRAWGNAGAWVVRLSRRSRRRAELRRRATPRASRFAIGVHLAGRVLPVALNGRLALADSSIDGARARVAARIADSVADPDAAALLTALAVGLTGGMSADQWRVFNATGTTHLVAISGLHVTMFAVLAFFCARRVWRWLPFAAWIEREPFALLSGLAAAGVYSLLAGFSVPTQRTWLMLAVFSTGATRGAACLSAGARLVAGADRRACCSIRSRRWRRASGCRSWPSA